MKATAHLTEEQVARYSDRTASAIEILELDEHVSACAACRDRLYARQGGSSRVRELRAELAGHLDYAAVVACSEGGATAEQRQHLQDCAMCQGEVLDLSRFRTELQDTRRAPLVMPSKRRKQWVLPVGIAAAVLLAAGLRTWRPRAPELQPVAVAEKHVEAPLPVEERQAVQLAMASQRLERSPVLDRLIAKRGTLRGSNAEDSRRFELLGPVGTTVLLDRPVFRWTPLRGANAYVVAVYDEQFNKVAESGTLTGTDWRPSKGLPRGQLLNWQVTAKLAGSPVHAPMPPAAEARFEVVPQETAERLENLRKEHPGDPLLLAVLFARAAALDDALEALRSSDADVAQHFRESIEQMRKQ